MNQNKKQISYEVCFKESQPKKSLPPKTRYGTKNLKSIDINEKNFYQMSSTFTSSKIKDEEEKVKTNGNKRVTK